MLTPRLGLRRIDGEDVVPEIPTGNGGTSGGVFVASQAGHGLSEFGGFTNVVIADGRAMTLQSWWGDNADDSD